MVTYNEVGGSMHPEAIKAQAVAVYTYIMNAGGSVDNLCPKPDPPQNVIDAVNAVLGEALYYNGGYALTLFSASSGGSTASCSDIFYEYVPYLTSVYCEYDSTCDLYYGIDTVISTEQVKSDLESSLGIILSDNPANWISVTEGDGGYAAYVTIDGQITIKGNDFIGILGLKSPKFTFAYG
jgi:SpoIID/LytB domain protein